MGLILGSASERRKKILEFFSLSFRQEASGFDESSIPFKGSCKKYVETIALEKAKALINRFPQDIILTADTVVYKDKKLFSKPQSKKEALALLETIAGSKVDVITGVAVAFKNQIFSSTETTKIFFHPLTEEEILIYHQKRFFQDAAGGYDISNAGSLIVKKIEGCFYNVLGMPLSTLKDLLLKVGINLWDHLS